MIQVSYSDPSILNMRFVQPEMLHLITQLSYPDWSMPIRGHIRITERPLPKFGGTDTALKLSPFHQNKYRTI